MVGLLKGIGMGAIALLYRPAPAQAQLAGAMTEMTVYRSPTCHCCGRWVDHVKAAGFEVQEVVTDEMGAIKDQYGVPENLASCHTAIVEGYVIEGHVPAADIQQLLSDRPEALGIAAPGMPVGAPGMESGDKVDAYTVVLFTRDGETSTFAEHP